MRWVTDKTGRFAKRPHYDPTELDEECERIVQVFLMGKYGKVEFPVSTNDLTVLIESRVEDLDMGTDLSEEGDDVEGLTEFKKGGGLPTVKISSELVGKPVMENRLRTTLTHELSHVVFHSFMYEVEVKPPSLFETSSIEVSSQQVYKCKRDNMIGAVVSDWMEWQAGYGCGALLMPLSSLTEVVKAFRKGHNLFSSSLSLDSSEGQELIQSVSIAFQTSRDAARVRLLQKRLLQDDRGFKAGNLFD